MNNQIIDNLLADSTVCGLKSVEQLEPVIGQGETIFPPSYAGGKYQIDRNPTSDESIVVLDSVGSQANRTEPIFKNKLYTKLVPQVEVALGSRTVNLLDIGHRGADAAIRLTDLGETLHKAFEKLEHDRNGVLLAKIAPTSLIFGAWDSRGTQAKARRVVRHTIDGSDVFEIKRSAQYTPPVNYIAEALVKEADIKRKSGDKSLGSKIGLLDNPATGALGGVRVKQIRRIGLLNLNVIRNLKGETPEDTDKLQRYLLGLALVAFTSPAELDLREGCELVHKLGTQTVIKVRHMDREEEFNVNAEEILKFAEAAAAPFVVGEDKKTTFDKKLAAKEISDALKKKEKKDDE